MGRLMKASRATVAELEKRATTADGFVGVFDEIQALVTKARSKYATAYRTEARYRGAGLALRNLEKIVRRAKKVFRQEAATRRAALSKAVHSRK